MDAGDRNHEPSHARGKKVGVSGAARTTGTQTRNNGRGEEHQRSESNELREPRHGIQIGQEKGQLSNKGGNGRA